MPEKDKFVSLVSRSTFACSLLVSPDESDVQLLDTNYPEDGIVDWRGNGHPANFAGLVQSPWWTASPA